MFTSKSRFTFTPALVALLVAAPRSFAFPEPTTSTGGLNAVETTPGAADQSIHKAQAPFFSPGHIVLFAIGLVCLVAMAGLALATGLRARRNRTRRDVGDVEAPPARGVHGSTETETSTHGHGDIDDDHDKASVYSRDSIQGLPILPIPELAHKEQRRGGGMAL
ncbi:hypothetical protein EXIGLDRAFT_838380 [Exidia glandulosa HHB12029]|uniref:Transmembrane protein n=1 Tax=Exidia glandulosa HHB12029 TaxID=1314781 RepID=A0A165FXB1_EXIGL|nr:hypothetical protein EXIGLDRAFT_838380 [Exidia glandulosa HHB12029]